MHKGLEKELQRFNRMQIYDIWNRVKSGEPLEGEEKVLGELMQAHTEYHAVWDKADKLVNKKYDPETDVNPFAHIAIDAAVVNQIEQRNPPEVRQVYNRLRAKGLSHLEAIHKIDLVFVEELWHVLKHRKPFDTARYVKKVKRL